MTRQKTEDIFIDNELFSDSDNKYIFIRYIFHIFCYQKGTKKNATSKKKKKSQKYKKIRQNKDKIKKFSKKAVEDMTKINHLETDDVETVNYNNDMEINNLSDAETVDYYTNYHTSKISKSLAQQQAKRIVKKYKNLKKGRQF